VPSLPARAAAVAASVLVAALAVEVGLRALGSRLAIYDVEMWKYARDLKRLSANPRLRHVHRPERRARLMGVEVAINARGLRDHDYPYAKPPGTYRVIALGDSITFGWGVPFEETYPKRLERLLNERLAARGRRYEVLNAGVGNWNTVQEVEWLRSEGLRYQPDLVLLGYFLNDAEPIVAPALDPASPVYRSHLAVFLWTSWSKLRLLVDDTGHYRAYYRDLYAGEGWDACRRAFADLARLAAEHRFATLAVLFPDLHDVGEERYPFRDIHARVVAVAHRHGIRTLDLLPTYASRPSRALVVARDDAHPNGHAHGLAAEAIYGWLAAHELGEGSAAPAAAAGEGSAAPAVAGERS
jgi:lysophospholipase L1-like esterase